MARRRLEPAGDLPEVPAQLRAFHYGEWADESGPVPAHWADVRDFPTWHHMLAFRRWCAARREWEREHGITLAELDRRVQAEALRERTLEALGEAAAFIEGEEPDPRWGQQLGVEFGPYPLEDLEPWRPE